MSRQKTEVITCDHCEQVIKNGSYEHMATVCRRELCRSCVEDQWKETEEAYRRMFCGEVRDRRGGWRKLGEFADT